jgi:beta-N-acetylhexosaminidase
MRETREPDELEDEIAAAGEAIAPAPEKRPAAGPGAHTRQPAPRRPAQRRSRRDRAVIWTASLVGTLAGLVLIASLVGNFFLVNTRTGARAPTPAAQLGITPTPETTHPLSALQRLNRALDVYISHMSLDDELGQMIQVQFVGPHLGQELTIPPAWLNELKKVHVGSVILYWYNIQSVSQLKALTSSLQSQDVAPNIPLMISTDEEGGEVDYLDRLYGSGPTEASLGASGNPQKAYNWGKLDAEHMKAVGINSDLAPVVDVKTTPNPSISLRMYGSDPTLVTNMASAFIDGLHSQGIMDCLKHWPGLGWSSVDAHAALPVSNRSLADLERIDFAPYKALLASGRVDMIMPTHVLLTAVDPKMPSSLSPILINNILRQQLGYQGVLITDALYMGAITSRYSMAEAAVLAVIAGNDILSSFYDPYSVEQVMAALHQAIKSGRITKARIDQSVRRILLLKMKYGLFHLPGYNG